MSRKHVQNNEKTLKEILGEASDSDFESPSTDENVTNYNITALKNTSLRNDKSKSKLNEKQYKQLNKQPMDNSELSTLSNRKVQKPPATSNNKARRKQPTPKKNNISREIYQLQQSSKSMIPKLPFSRVIREILMNYGTTHTKMITFDALKALHEIAEVYIVALFEDSYLCTLHRNRVTLEVKDIELTRYFRGMHDPLNK